MATEHPLELRSPPPEVSAGGLVGALAHRAPGEKLNMLLENISYSSRAGSKSTTSAPGNRDR